MIEIISIIGFIISLITLICVVYVCVTKKNSNNYNLDELKNYIKSLLDEQVNLTNQINNYALNSINENNKLVISSISNSSSLQLQQLSDIMNRLDRILNTNAEQMKNATEVLQNGLNKIQQGNESKLEQMRQTVDEKLNATLDRRLNDSFTIISQRLQEVYTGLGEMKNLATGVGDLKKVLTNVKTRGTWGETQLGNLLEQMLSPKQYANQVQIKSDSQERVDYVVYLPGKDDKNIFLPIDAKFPIEDYQRLVDASERGDLVEIDNSKKALIKRIKEEAKSICSKYISVPDTTDFAIMYLSLEGLYAEAIKTEGLTETLQRDYKVTVAGPTTLSALLSSLQLGFKTLAIQKRSSEVWSLLGTIKQEFGNFSVLLEKTQKKLSEASNTIENAARKSRTIERKLRNVELNGSNGDPLDKIDLIPDENDE